MTAASRQRGATLIITLILLMVILMLGAASVRLCLLEHHAARHHRALAQARLAAQAALDDALIALRGASWPDATPIAPTSAVPIGSASKLAARFDDDHLPQPRYQIESIPLPARPQLPTGARPAAVQQLYRITAWGFGPAGARTSAQMLVRREQVDEQQIDMQLLGWRPAALP